MGDFRTYIKIKVEWSDKKYERELNINYTPKNSGYNCDCDILDKRVIDTFKDIWLDIKDTANHRIFKEEVKRKAKRAKEKKQVVEKELKELKRLKEKYD